MASTINQLRTLKLEEIDIFAPRFSLRHNGKAFYQTRFGGVFTLVFAFLGITVFAATLRLFVIGYQPGLASTTDGMLWNSDNLSGSIDIAPHNLKFGFMRRDSVLTTTATADSLSDAIGRFELLKMTKGDDTELVRITPEECSDDREYLCFPTEDFSLAGDLQ